MDSLKGYKKKLDRLEAMLSQLHSKHQRVKHLKRSVYVLRAILNDNRQIQSPYGPPTPIAKFSLQ